MKRKITTPGGHPVSERKIMQTRPYIIIIYMCDRGNCDSRGITVKTKRSKVRALALAGLAVLLALCLFAGASSAQSKDKRKDRTGGEGKREEPRREERSERVPERAPERSTAREKTERPERESGDRTTRERPDRDERTERDRPDSGDRRSDRGGSSGSGVERTPPERSPADGTTSPIRRRPPRERDGDYDRSRGGTDVPDDYPRVRPPRERPSMDVLIKKEVPIPDDRIRIIVEGWPYPPPWYPGSVRRYIVDPGFTYNPYLIHLPFGTIEPRTVEEEFLLMLNDLYYDGLQEAQIICIVQTYRSMDVDLFGLFFGPDEEVTIYGRLTRNAFLVRIPVYAVFELLDDPRIRWVGDYKPYYKINDSVKLWEWDGALVFSLEGDSEGFRADLVDAGLGPEYYDEEIGYYFVQAGSYDLERLASFWWVAEVLEVVSDPGLVYDYGNVRY